MSRRIIHMPALGRRMPLGVYVAGVKRAKAAPDTDFKTGLTTWWPTSGAEIMRQFRDGMHARINAGISYQQRGTAACQIAPPPKPKPKRKPKPAPREEATAHGPQLTIAGTWHMPTDTERQGRLF